MWQTLIYVILYIIYNTQRFIDTETKEATLTLSIVTKLQLVFVRISAPEKSVFPN